MGGRGARRWIRYLAPLLLAALLVVVAVVFHAVLLPFLVGTFIAFLIEPVVARLASMRWGGRRVSRWVAVIVVYVVGLGLATLLGAIFLPRLASEVSSLAVDAPRMIREIREERLPTLNERLEGILQSVVPVPSPDVPMQEAEARIGVALGSAATRADLMAALSPDERDAFDRGDLALHVEEVEVERDPVLFRIRPGQDGTFDVLAGADDIVFSEEGDGGWRVSAGEDAPADAGSVDVERALTESFGDALEGGGDAVHSLIVWTQHFVTELLHTVWLVFVTFMVAAFISIDVPRISAFVHDLFPTERRPQVAVFVGRLGAGLSGVIRGQLLICAINGVLTWVGLAVFGVKFAVLLACIAAVFSLIPIFGTILSSVPAVAIALTQSVSTALLVLAWILVIHFIEGNLLNPRIMGSAAKIHPVIVVFALLAGEHSFGLVGALLAVPAASIVQTTFQFIRDYANRNVATDEGAHEDQGQLED